MKKFAIGALTALVATVSLASTADAGWRHRHHGFHHNNHWGVVVVSPRIYTDYCFTKKVKRYDRWGNLYVKRIRICD